jgi:hypothetical protein
MSISSAKDFESVIRTPSLKKSGLPKKGDGASTPSSANMEPTVKAVHKQSQASEKSFYPRRSRASYGYNSHIRLTFHKADVKKAVGICQKAIVATRQWVDNQTDQDMFLKAMAVFFGAKVDLDSKWEDLLWTGGFFPILAFVGTYATEAVDWGTVLDSKTDAHLRRLEELAPRMSKAANAYVAYLMALCYIALGNTALSAIVSKMALDAYIWSACTCSSHTSLLLFLGKS